MVIGEGGYGNITKRYKEKQTAVEEIREQQEAEV